MALHPLEGWALFPGLSDRFAAISTAVGGYFYKVSLDSFIAQKADEKATALRLVDAFVTTYSQLRSRFGKDAPVPATFRAHSIENFNNKAGSSNPLVLRWVGRQGRQIATPPSDTEMGAFAIDVPIGAFVTELRNESYTIGLGLFLVLGTIGLIISVLHFHQLNEREAASSEWRTQNVRFNAALNNMSQGLCMFDANRRLVVSNERYARMYALPPELLKPGTTYDTIIKHRVANGILAGDQSEAAVAQKLTDLNKHSVETKSSRIDKLADGRLVKVTRDPMPGGGWVATHEDVTERAHRELIDSAISSFRERVEAMLKTVNESTESMKSTAAKLFGSSERTSQRAKGIVGASQGASTNVQNAAATTRQMSASAEEISQQIA